MWQVDLCRIESAGAFRGEQTHYVVEKTERHVWLEMVREGYGIRRSILQKRSKLMALGVEPEHRGAAFQHVLENLDGKDLAFSIVDIAAPSNEVLGSFRIDGVAGDFDGGYIEADCSQSGAQKRYEVGVASSAERRLDQILAHLR